MPRDEKAVLLGRDHTTGDDFWARWSSGVVLHLRAGGNAITLTGEALANLRDFLNVGVDEKGAAK